MLRPIRSMMRIFISIRWPSHNRTQYFSIKLVEEVIFERTNSFYAMIRGRHGWWSVYAFGSKNAFGSKKAAIPDYAAWSY